MKRFTGLVTSFSRTLDQLAGFCMVAVMMVVVGNVLLRAIFKSPILGAYEYVGYLTALMISLALAYCAVQNAHIAVGIVVDRLSRRSQGFVDLAVHTLGLVFWLAAAWHLVQHGRGLAASGVVSATAQIPFYPFVYLVAAGLLALSLVLLVKLVEALVSVRAGSPVVHVAAAPVELVAGERVAGAVTGGAGQARTTPERVRGGQAGARQVVATK